MTNNQQPINLACPIPSYDLQIIKLGHGSGGKMTESLIEKVFLPLIGNDILNERDDAAIVSVENVSIAITTDSYVVSPIFFPGGDIGSLSIHGTINDLAMRGARPLFISAAFIMEEGLPIGDLQKIIASVHEACLQSGVTLVAADTKVVNHGAADKLFITTTGIGLVSINPAPACNRAMPGDAIIISGDIGRHGIAVMTSREGLDLETEILTDSCSINDVVQAMLQVGQHKIHCLRDITRGGLSGVLNELAIASDVGMTIEEEFVPLHPQVKAVCELLGLDPLYVACEGRFVAIVDADCAEQMLEIMSRHACAQDARIIGTVVQEHKSRVVLRSCIGGNRILDKLSGEQLPRIC